MATLFDATLALARAILPIYDGIVDATPAPTTTAVSDADFQWDEGLGANGTFWLKTGTYAGNSRPIKAVTANRIYWLTALGGAPAAGNAFSVAPNRHPMDRLVDAVNAAIRESGDYEASYSDAAFLTVAEQEEYSLPANVSRVTILEIATLLDAPYRYVENHYWREVGGKIRFAYGAIPQVAGYRIRLTYPVTPTLLAVDADNVPSHLNPDRLLWESAVWLYRKDIEERRAIPPDEPIQELLNEAGRKAAACPEHPKMQSSSARLAVW